LESVRAATSPKAVWASWISAIIVSFNVISG
jgi:hypothetical protein